MSFRTMTLVGLALLLATPAAHARKKKKAEPGTVAAESEAAPLTLAASGDAYVRLDDAKPARFTLTGPAKFQVDFRLVFLGDERPTVVLSLFAEGKPVQSYRVPSRSGGGDWKDSMMKASLGTGFYVDVPEGEQTWELRTKGTAPSGAAVYVVNAPLSKKPLASTAPVLRTAPAAVAIASATVTPSPAAPPVAAASPAASPVAAASPSASPAATATPLAAVTPRPASGAWAAEAALIGYVRWAEKPLDPVAPGIAVTVLRPIGLTAGPAAMSAGAAVGWRHHTGGRTLAEYRGRILAPYVADIEAVPIEAVVRGAAPIGGIGAFAQAGAGMEYARSSYAKADGLRRRENDWALTESLAAGVERPLFGGRAGARVGARFSRHSFAVHEMDLLHGVETALQWSRSF